MSEPLVVTLRLEAPGLDALRASLAQQGVTEGPDPGGVVYAPAVPKDWPGLEEGMLTAYRLTRALAARGGTIVYLTRAGDLLGQQGVPGAILANALLSAARSLAMEGRRHGVRANVVAYEEPLDPAAAGRWIRFVLESPGPSGELIRLGAGHLGRVIP